MNINDRIYIAGHKGLVGSAILKKLKACGFSNLITRTHKELDLTMQADVSAFIEAEKPEYILLAAAKVGGILANNNFPADFIYSNLVIQNNVIHAAWQSGVKRLFFLGSSCIYPRKCVQPMKEEYLLTGALEPTNEPYAIAKIAGVKMCQSYNRQYGTQFLPVMPTNLYGPNDNFDLETSHVLPALLRKFHMAKFSGQKSLKENNENFVTIWGTGRPRREFLHVDDLADACFFLMNLADNVFASLLSNYKTPLINIGFGKDISILELARLIKDIIKFDGKIVFDDSKPDGTPQKLLDISRMKHLGWNPKISIRNGIQNTYKWCLENSIF